MNAPVKKTVKKSIILTEKPSVARDFAKALKANQKKNGFYFNDHITITWAIGHLVELFEPGDYDLKWKKWDLYNLPILPADVKYRPLQKTIDQLNILKKLFSDKFDDIIIATDAGREGEVIARTILTTCNISDYSSVKRFWTSQALTNDVIFNELKNLKPAQQFDRLWNAGQARQIADWKIGMNCSRLASILLKDLFSVGRVQTAVLALLVDRKRKREAFEPEPYWLLKAAFKNENSQWWGSWFHKKETQFDDKAKAQKIVEKIANQKGVIKSLKTSKKSQAPPLLYALTDLQRDANSQFGFSASLTLEIAQSLYEDKKCLSYPRTDAKVLGSQSIQMVQTIINKLNPVYPAIFQDIDKTLIAQSNKRVFNDKKLTDHHALIPLAKLPANASDNESKIYNMVLKRFAAAFHPDCEFLLHDLITEVCNETFQSKDKVITKWGWQKLYDKNAMTKGGEAKTPKLQIAKITKGDEALCVESKLEEKKTLPPPEYTDALLLKDMTDPSRYVSEKELKKIFKGDVGLGTQATRAQIIETLYSRKYVIRKKRYLIATDKGCQLIDTLRTLKVGKSLTLPNETANWERELELIAQDQAKSNMFMDNIDLFIRELVDEVKSFSRAKGQHPIIGKCPNCSGQVIEGKKNYGCLNWKKTDGGCVFRIPKFFLNIWISPQMASTLIIHKSAGPYDGFETTQGKSTAGIIKLVHNEANWIVDFEPAPSDTLPTQNKDSLGVCPVCGGLIKSGPKTYGCQNWKIQDGGCHFSIWKKICQKEITEEIASQLLKNGQTDVLEGFVSKKGKPFSSRLCIQYNDLGKLTVGFRFQ